MKKNWLGWRVGGLRVGGLSWGPVRGYTVSLASYHNPKCMCWLWSARVEMTTEDEKRAFRVFSMPGSQAKYYLQLWSICFVFMWQEMGKYAEPEKMRQADMAKKFRVKL